MHLTSPDLSADPWALGQDGGVVLAINAMTGTVKEWVEERLPDAWLPYARRCYVVLPLACAFLLTFLEHQDVAVAFPAAVKYGMAASWVYMAKRAGVEGR